MAAGSRGCMTALISVANLIIIILAIAIMCLSVYHWNDYVSASLTILVALCWACCVCVENNVALSCYSVLMTVDMLILLANAIYYSVIVKRYSSFCDDMSRTDLSGPEWGCHDWRRTDKVCTIVNMAFFYVAFALRLFNIIGSCLLARSIYQAV